MVVRVCVYALQVQAAAEAEQLTGHLIWLNFVDQLLQGPGGSLLASLKFDGTHLAPSYITYLEQALQQLR